MSFIDNKCTWLILLATVVTLGSCKKETTSNCTADTTLYSLQVPDYFPELNIPADNPMTVEGIQLGRRLYYDRLLSSGGPRDGYSCSKCHSQANSFSKDTLVGGHSVIPHINLAWSRSFLWNGLVQGKLEDITMFEVSEFFEADMQLLADHDPYPELFRKAFGSCNITQELAAKALAQWFRSLVSSNSRYDQYLRHEIQFTESELNGMNIFYTEKGDCFHCHGLPLMTDNGFHNIGLDSIFTPDNHDRSTVTHNPNDVGKFKAPTLRNIELTSRYMHDGRFTTLEEVVEHYNSQVKISPTVDPIMTKPGKEYGLQLTETDKQDLIAFLHTLTDWDYVNDTTLSSPF